MIEQNKTIKNFGIYKDKKVVIWGVSYYSIRFGRALKSAGISIYAYCTEDPNTWGKLVTGFSGCFEEQKLNVPIISPHALSILNLSEPTIVQIGVTGQEQTTIAVSQLKKLGIENYIIYDNMTEFFSQCSYGASKWYNKKGFFETLSEDWISAHQTLEFLDILSRREGNMILTVMPPKTGNHTIESVFQKLNIFTYGIRQGMPHEPRIYNKEILSSLAGGANIKVVTAVREPISQMIALMFELIDWPVLPFGKTLAELNRFDNIQETFEMFLDCFQSKSCPFPWLIPQFFDKFNEHILDVMKQPFDKEKGYCIMKEGSIEVFIYQLEKIDDAWLEMKKWINSSKNIELPRGNDGSKKWTADSYKQAKKELRFPQEFIDNCYNNPIVRHFYSESDIEKFKKVWQSNLK